MRNISNTLLKVCQGERWHFWRKKGVQPFTRKVYLIKAAGECIGHCFPSVSVNIQSKLCECWKNRSTDYCYIGRTNYICITNSILCTISYLSSSTQKSTSPENRSRSTQKTILQTSQRNGILTQPRSQWWSELGGWRAGSPRETSSNTRWADPFFFLLLFFGQPSNICSGGTNI